jgi:hypothetical protein
MLITQTRHARHTPSAAPAVAALAPHVTQALKPPQPPLQVGQTNTDFGGELGALDAVARLGDQRLDDGQITVIGNPDPLRHMHRKGLLSS